MKNKLNVPLINTHSHATMIAFRGLGEDLPLDNWLNDCIWPLEQKHLSNNFVYKNTKLAIAEMKKNNIYAFNDMYFFEDEVAKIAIEEKIHVVIGEGILDFSTSSYKNIEEALQITENLILKYADNEFVQVSVAPHSIYTVSRENLIRCKDLAKKYDCIYHIHISETKKEFDDCLANNKLTPIEYLDSIGVLDNKTILAHCVYLGNGDFDILKRTGAHVSHCPLSNLKLGSGVAPIAKMLDYGINVTLGTDGSASSNRLDIWEAGKIAGLLQKGFNHNPSLLKAKDIIKMMSINGMKALGIQKINGLSIKDYEKIINETLDYSYLYHLNINEI